MLGVVTLGVRPLLVMPASGHPERPTAQVRESPAPDHELPMGAGAACEKRETPEHIEIGKYYLATCSNPLYSLKIRDPSPDTMDRLPDPIRLRTTQHSTIRMHDGRSGRHMMRITFLGLSIALGGCVAACAPPRPLVSITTPFSDSAFPPLPWTGNPTCPAK